MKINEIRCKSILNKSGIPNIDYAINPYVGCGHKCQYCYAVFMKRFSGHFESWGEFVDVKINAPEVLIHQLKKLNQQSHISFGTVCDAYQPLEEKYRITRRCLEILIYYKHRVSILTKSALILRDLDLLKKLKEREVGFTITTLNPKIIKVFEPITSSPQKRFEAAKTFVQNKISTWIFVAPLLPYLGDSKSAITQIFKVSQEAHINYILFDTLNPYPKVWHNATLLIRKHFPEALAFYDYYYHNKSRYENEIKKKITEIGNSFKIKFDFAF